MKRAITETTSTGEPTQAVQPFDFLGLDRDLQLLILTAVGHDIFALNCVCAAVRQLIANPKHRVMESNWAFRFFFHMNTTAPRERHFPLGCRLLLLQPQVLNIAYRMQGLDWDTVLALNSSLTALSIYSCHWCDDSAPERVLGQLTALRHLALWDCAFESHADESSSHDVCDQLALLTGLESLSICSDEQFATDIVRQMTRLRHLDFNCGVCLYFEDVTHLQQLETLSMDAEEVREAGQRWQSCLTNLTCLHLINTEYDEPPLPDLTFLPARIQLSTEQAPLPRLAQDKPANQPQYYWMESSSSSSSDSESEPGCRECTDSADDPVPVMRLIYEASDVSGEESS